MVATGSDQTGTLEAALASAAQLLETDPANAQAQALEILKAIPDQPEAQLFLGAALRRQGYAARACTVLKKLAKARPLSAAAQYELGLALGETGDDRNAIVALLRACQLNPKHSDAWRALSEQFTRAGDEKAATDAYARHLQASVNGPKLLEAAAALCDNKLAIAERILREFLKENPTDVSAIRMLAEIGARLGRYEDAENLLARAVELAPAFDAARHNYATVLNRQNKPAEALAQIELLLKREPRNAGYRALQAAALVGVGEYAEAVIIYEALLREFLAHPKGWLSYGHTLKAIGRSADSIAAYRKSIALLPNLGEAYWSLANLKTFRFTDAEVAAMRAQLARDDLAEEDRFHLHFALGKALEDAGAYDESFAQYERGNEQRRTQTGYESTEISAHIQRLKGFFTPAFFAARKDWGNAAADPVFIVGLPRAGSTLIEQILSSHSLVEGTMELPDVIAIARRLGGKKKKGEISNYPDVLSGMDREQIAALGAEYLDRTRVQRKLGRPYFIDKMPNNFLHTGLIHLMLPNAKIIDARRHPLACCFSGYKQHFARGQNFTYSLEDIGRYYADYVELMAHYDAVLPGRVHRVIYERMVADPEQEVRKLLDYCGLPFEDGCLRFYENDRAVRTASSEQVRMPIFKDGVDHWQSYEPWLGPLKTALGPVLPAYPAAPVF